VAVTAVLALVGVWRVLSERGFGFLLYPAAALASCTVVVVLGSAWVDAKALAIASPAVVVTAFAGVSALVAWRWRPGAVVAGVAAAALAAGVLWSNALAYGEVNLAPRERLAELERIGRRIAGEGPTLMTDYEPYGARYFLRDAEPEGASELRRRQVPVRAGGTLPKGRSADLDELRLDAVLPNRTLVVRRSPLASRPPLPYRLVWSGRYYEVWQRPATGAGETVLEHLPVVSTRGAGCEQVRRAARVAGRSGRVAAAPRPAAIRLDLARGGRPSTWRPSAARPGALLPAGAGEARGPCPCRRRAATRSGSGDRFTRESSCSSTAGPSDRLATSSPTTARTCGWARWRSPPAATWSSSATQAPTCTRGAPGSRARSARWCWRPSRRAASPSSCRPRGRASCAD
jgi:hypothetical protein